MTLVPVDPTNALAVSDYLTKARDWLATAVERTGPSEIAAAKAEIATAAEATKQLGLSKEIQLDAKEMVRRAEYALARSIRVGQANGTVNAQGQGSSGTWGPGKERRSPESTTTERAHVYDLLPTGSERAHAAAVVELTPEQFDEAIDEAKAEGNLSRANVARKATERSEPRPANRRALPDVARDMGIDLRRLTERFERLRADDRFGRNKNEVAAHLRHHLAHALAVLTDLEQEINSHQENSNG